MSEERSGKFGRRNSATGNRQPRIRWPAPGAMASADTTNWQALTELMRRMMLTKRQSACDAEDFASEAVTAALAWLGAATKPERQIWTYAMTTCKQRLASAIRNPRTAETARVSLDDVVDGRGTEQESDGRTRQELSTAELLRLLLARLTGTARNVLLLLQQRPHTNVEMAALLGVQLRTIELAKATIRARAVGFRGDFFGVEPPSWWRRYRRPSGREAEQGDPAC